MLSQTESRSWPLWISLVSIILSFGSLYYTGSTYRVSQRPYVGILDIKTSVNNKVPATEFHWNVLIKNSGSVPAWVTVIKHKSIVTFNGRKTTLPTIPETSIFLLTPQQINIMGGNIKDKDHNNQPGPILVKDLIEGKGQLDLEISLTYESINCIFFCKYRYQAQYELAHVYTPPSFNMLPETALAD